MIWQTVTPTPLFWMIVNFIMNPNENIMDTNLQIRSVQSSSPSCVLAKNFSKSDLDKSLRTDRLP